MPILQNISKPWYDRPWAAFIFFTRLPLWRLHEPHPDAYRAVVECWPLTGWLTAAVMATTLWLASQVFCYEIAIVLAIVSRLLLTGALHEDGLADFCDGFGGGGSDRERILSIMKDSHIGTYGVLALVIYLLLLFFALYSLHPIDAVCAILLADPYAKMLSAWPIQLLPYARTAETAKNRTVYRRMAMPAALGLAFQGLLPIGCYLWWRQDALFGTMLMVIPALAMFLLFRLISHRLHGYTGDCCGAIFLLTELSAFLVISYFLSC